MNCQGLNWGWGKENFVCQLQDRTPFGYLLIIIWPLQSSTSHAAIIDLKSMMPGEASQQEKSHCMAYAFSDGSLKTL